MKKEGVGRRKGCTQGVALLQDVVGRYINSSDGRYIFLLFVGKLNLCWYIFAYYCMYFYLFDIFVFTTVC